MGAPLARVGLAAMLVGALALAGCAAASDGGSADSAPAASATAASYSGADVMFGEGMVPHHERAVEMADIVLEKDGVDPRVIALAEQIKAAQQPEIQRLNAMLESWGQGSSDGGGDHGGHGGTGSGGMMREEDLATLEQAEGVGASRLFLEQMIVHHEGAVMMADEQLASGENPDALEMAQEIVDAKRAEIESMREILASL